MNDSWLRYLPGFAKRRLEGRHELQKVIGNTGWLFADKVVRMGLGLLVGVWVARYLGPSQFGLLNFAGSFVTLFSAVALLGLESIIVRELVRAPVNKEELLGTTFFLRLLSGGFSFAAAMLAISIIRPQEPTTHILVALSGGLLIFQAFDVIDLWFQSEVRSRYVVMAKNGAFLLSAALKVALVLAGARLVAFAAANFLEIALGAVGLIIVYRMNGEFIFRWRARSAKVRELLKESFPLLLSGIVFMVYLRVDQVMLGQMAGDREVGVYAAAVRVAEIWYFIPVAVVSSVFPNIIKARESDEGEFYRRLQRLYNLLAFMGYAVAVPVTFLAGWIIRLLFGDSYVAAGPMLAVLVWAGLFANLAVARNAFLLSMNWTRILFLMSLAGAFSNILLNIMLIPRFGGVGAALASIISYWIVAHGGCYFCRSLKRTTGMITKALVYPRFW